MYACSRCTSCTCLKYYFSNSSHITFHISSYPHLSLCHLQCPYLSALFSLQPNYLVRGFELPNQFIIWENTRIHFQERMVQIIWERPSKLTFYLTSSMRFWWSHKRISDVALFWNWVNLLIIIFDQMLVDGKSLTIFALINTWNLLISVPALLHAKTGPLNSMIDE